jgi:hypothetical protein
MSVIEIANTNDDGDLISPHRCNEEEQVMTKQDDIALMAHLMRRAGFGASRDELEARVAKGYEATVEELLAPSHPSIPMCCCAISRRRCCRVGSPRWAT